MEMEIEIDAYLSFPIPFTYPTFTFSSLSFASLVPILLNFYSTSRGLSWKGALIVLCQQF